MPDQILRNRTMYHVQWRDRMSEAYRDLMSSVFREQAARTLQRYARRLLRRESAQSVSTQQIPKVTQTDSIYCVVKEPIDKTYQKHVEKINAGTYLELDFTDPQFVRNLYKSLRLNAINKNQLFKALQIYQAKEWLHDYDYPGPQLHAFNSLDHRHFSFLFKNKELYPPATFEIFLSRLQPEDQHCVTLNLPRLNELAFFEFNPNLERIHPIFNVLHSLYTLRRNPTLLANINAASAKDIDSMKLFLIALGGAKHMPVFTISPDYDEDNPDSPLVCLTLFTPEAQRQLQLALRYEDETTRTELVACPITTRQIRAYDERPQVRPAQSGIDVSTSRKLTDADLKKMRNASAAEIMHALYGAQYAKYSTQARPVEITHPDLVRIAKVHSMEAYDFLFTGHDLYHTWENGEFFKPIIRHVRALLSRRGICHEKDFLMTKTLWTLSDLSLEKQYYNQYQDHRRVSFFLLVLFDVTLRKPIDVTYLGCINKDLYFLIFIDMIKNHEQWNNYFEPKARRLGIQENFRQFMTIYLNRDAINNRPTVDDTYLFGNVYPHGDFLEIASRFDSSFKDEALISMIQSNASKSNEYLILRCRLKDQPHIQQLCDDLEEAGIQKFIYWTANEGLHFKSEYHEFLRRLPLNTFELENIEDTELVDALTLCLAAYKNQGILRICNPTISFAEHDRLKSASSLQRLISQVNAFFQPATSERKEDCRIDAARSSQSR